MTSRANRHRRGRSALFWAAAAFAAGQLLTGALLDHVFPLVRFPFAARVLQSLDRQPTPPRLLILGSSRAGCGLHAEQINLLLASASQRTASCRAFNASVPAGDTLTAEYLYDLVRRRGQRPDWLFVEVSPETLNCPSSWMAGHVERQLTWADLPTHLPDAIRTNSALRYLRARLLPGLVHGEAICDAMCQALRPSEKGPAAPAAGQPAASGPLDWGELLRPLPAKAVPAERLALVRHVGSSIPRWLRSYHIDGLSPAALERLLGRCRAEGVGVVLLAPPVSTALRAQYTPAIEAAFQTYLGDVTRRFGCAFVDARDWVPDELFLDCHHLDSGTGSPYFTSLFTRRVLLPLLFEQRAGSDLVKCVCR